MRSVLAATCYIRPTRLSQIAENLPKRPVTWAFTCFQWLPSIMGATDTRRGVDFIGFCCEFISLRAILERVV